MYNNTARMVGQPPKRWHEMSRMSVCFNQMSWITFTIRISYFQCIIHKIIILFISNLTSIMLHVLISITVHSTLFTFVTSESAEKIRCFHNIVCAIQQESDVSLSKYQTIAKTKLKVTIGYCHPFGE